MKRELFLKIVVEAENEESIVRDVSAFCNVKTKSEIVVNETTFHSFELVKIEKGTNVLID